MQRYSTATRYAPKERAPGNSFNISMVPWVEFTNFNINVFVDGKFLLLAIQVHHAVCDGYHIGVFVQKLQRYIDQF